MCLCISVAKIIIIVKMFCFNFMQFYFIQVAHLLP